MKKTIEVDQVGNGLLLTIKTPEGNKEVFVVPKDDSMAFSMFEDAYKAADGAVTASPPPPGAGSDRNGEPAQEASKPTSQDYEDLLNNPAVRAGLGRAFDFLSSASSMIDKGRKGTG